MDERTGATIGVEEEYHLVDPRTTRLRASADLTRRVLDGMAGPHLRAEMLTSQLEAVTDVCRTLDEIRTAVVAMRREAAAAASRDGAAILATSTHPSAPLSAVELTGRDRYASLVARFGAVTSAFNLCGFHVHVSVPHLEEAILIMSRARAYLPLLSALTGSSPFHGGIDTGYSSFRVAWLALWPQGGIPPEFPSASAYRETVDELAGLDMIDEPTQLLWELRPSARYPTLEFRIADVCPDVDDVVLLTGLARSLVRALGNRRSGIAAPGIPDAVLRGARWRAARYGLADRLWSARQRRLLPAAETFHELLGALEPDLRDHDEWDVVHDLAERLLSRGPSAVRQRRVFADTGDLDAVVRDGLALSATG